MSALNEPIARRIGKLVRMFSSPHEDRHVDFTQLEHLLKDEGLSFNDLATVIENCNGEIEELKYSDNDMANVADRMKRRGEQEGYDKARREMTAPPKFYEDHGEPRYYEIAMYCRSNKERLAPRLGQDFRRGHARQNLELQQADPASRKAAVTNFPGAGRRR